MLFYSLKFVSSGFPFSEHITCAVFPAFLLNLFTGEEIRGLACHGMCVESEDSSQELVLSPPCESQGWKSGCQARWEVPLPNTESSLAGRAGGP